METYSPVKTVDRLVEILNSFSLQQPEWSLGELSAHLGIPKSTLHRFLLALEAHGIVLHNPRNRRWRLGYRLLVWGHLASAHNGLRLIARPIMEELAAETGETILLTVYDNLGVLCIEKVDSAHAVRLTMEVGSRRPPHAGASSKILMAYLPETEIEAIIERGLPKLCTNTITDPDELRTELARIRRQGYAISKEETDIGAWGVATPIWDQYGEVIAAIGIAGPLFRLTGERTHQYVEKCRWAAQRISVLLSGGRQYSVDEGGDDRGP